MLRRVHWRESNLYNSLLPPLHVSTGAEAVTPQPIPVLLDCISHFVIHSLNSSHPPAKGYLVFFGRTSHQVIHDEALTWQYINAGIALPKATAETATKLSQLR